MTTAIARWMLIGAAVGFSMSAALAAEVPWAYEGPKGPDRWASLDTKFAACGGAQQSPIDLRADNAIVADLPTLEYAWTKFKPDVVDTGHTIQVNTGGGGGQVRLDGKVYDFLQFHFHRWSEHTVDGANLPIEIHFVHRSEDGALLVIGGFFAEGESNGLLGDLWSLIPPGHGNANAKGEIDPTVLRAKGGRVFRYQGSLTTPPCSEIVTWIIYAEPVSASAAEIVTFGARYEMNNRPLQTLNRRVLLTDR